MIVLSKMEYDESYNFEHEVCHCIVFCCTLLQVGIFCCFIRVPQLAHFILYQKMFVIYKFIQIHVCERNGQKEHCDDINLSGLIFLMMKSFPTYTECSGFFYFSFFLFYVK